MAQANAVKAQLEALDPLVSVEIITIRTSGDKGDRDRLGAFVGEIQDALQKGQIDLALHCLKDLPTGGIQGLRLSAHLAREDAREAFISRGESLENFAPKAIVGTGSLRRTSQLSAIRPDLQFRPLIGNVDTRLRKLMDGEYDAIVLAIAGLKRLGVLDTWENSDYSSLTIGVLSEELVLPAPGQAVLVLETREFDADTHRLVRGLNHQDTEICANAERAFLKAFGGGCSVPVAASAAIDGARLTLTGLVASSDGSRVIRRSRSFLSSDLANAVESLFAEFEADGALEIVREALLLNRPGGMA